MTHRYVASISAWEEPSSALEACPEETNLVILSPCCHMPCTHNLVCPTKFLLGYFIRLFDITPDLCAGLPPCNALTCPFSLCLLHPMGTSDHTRQILCNAAGEPWGLLPPLHDVVLVTPLLKWHSESNLFLRPGDVCARVCMCVCMRAHVCVLWKSKPSPQLLPEPALHLESGKRVSAQGLIRTTKWNELMRKSASKLGGMSQELLS